MGGSILHPHQRAADRAEQGRGLGPIGDTPAVVQPIGEPLQRPAPLGERQRSDEIQHQDGERLRQPIGRQFGRRARHRLRGEG